jgi:hypothetical protein
MLRPTSAIGAARYAPSMLTPKLVWGRQPCYGERIITSAPIRSGQRRTAGLALT